MLSRRRDDKVDTKFSGAQSAFAGAHIEDDDIRDDSLVRLKQTHAPKPQYVKNVGDFEEYPEITQKTIDKLKARGIVNLFPIQQGCFYPIYNREDVIARDLTGSGKTLAVGLPIVEYLRRNKMLGTKCIQAIVLAPTRELALQVSIKSFKSSSY